MKRISQLTSRQALIIFLTTALIVFSLTFIPESASGVSKEFFKDTPKNSSKNISNISHAVKKHFTPEEFNIILEAAERNGCYGDDFLLLLAIGLAENSENRPFGIMHPKCDKIMKERPDDIIDIQAGWGAATIVKNKERWKNNNEGMNFIEYLGNRWAPIGAENDPEGLNVNWIPNVTSLFEKLKQQ